MQLGWCQRRSFRGSFRREGGLDHAQEAQGRDGGRDLLRRYSQVRRQRSGADRGDLRVDLADRGYLRCVQLAGAAQLHGGREERRIDAACLHVLHLRLLRRRGAAAEQHHHEDDGQQEEESDHFGFSGWVEGCGEEAPAEAKPMTCVVPSAVSALVTSARNTSTGALPNHAKTPYTPSSTP